MKRYRNLSGSSGVVAYDTSGDGSTVKFRDGDVYLYDYLCKSKRSSGAATVQLRDQAVTAEQL